MPDSSRADVSYGLKNFGAEYTGPLTNQTTIAASATAGAFHILHDIVFSSDQAGSILVKDNLAGNQAIIVQKKFFGAYGGLGLSGLSKKARPGASIEITTTGGGTQTIEIVYHTKGERG